MTPEEIAKKEADERAAADAKAIADAALSQEVDPVKQELERVQKQGRTEAEKAAFSLKKNADRAKELGLDPAEVLGIQPGGQTVDKSAPLTVEMYEQIKRDEAQKTSLQLADDISDESERELTKHYLKTRIVPSGDPAADLRFARSAVNSVKNAQILEEEGRRGETRSHASGAGAPPKPAAQETELTAAELPFMKAPWNMTKEQIVAKRPKA